VCPLCGLRTVDVGTATDSRGGLQSSCGTLDWCENGTEDFVQMICLQWGRQRPNDRCQTAVSEGRLVNGACDEGVEGCLSLGVDLEGAARGARKELSRRGRSAWRQRLAGESRQQRLLWVWVLAGCWAARKVVADGGSLAVW
jgi:hypothetical protein